MSKELTPLEVLDKLVAYILLDDEYGLMDKQEVKNVKHDKKIIKSELKRLEKQDNVIKVLKEVVAFGKVLPRIEPNKEDGFDILSAISINIQRDIENRERELLRQWVLGTCFPKELKALEIIKNKKVDIELLSRCETLKDYNWGTNLPQLNEQEFNLLKEVLL